jgi:LDH2 family malate/lactate/ureidoglycolate dehydrogenase
VQAGQSVIIPGDPERAAEKDRRENGIPLTEPVLADLKQLANHLNLQF